MFLQELPSSGVPDLDELDTVALNRRARYKQRLRNNLRERFRREYLGELRLHSQKKNKFQALKVGDIVLLEDTSGKRIHWPLAKVVQLCPGRDGIVRLARVQTQNGIYLRPVQRLFPLEMCNSSSASDETIPQAVAVPKDSPPTEPPCSSPVAPTTRVFTRSGREVKPPSRFQSC